MWMPSTPGTPLRDRLAHRVDGALHHVQIVADQRGQKARRAEAAVRAADGGDALDARIVVEQHAAAAVHLRVDEARDEQARRRDRWCDRAR